MVCVTNHAWFQHESWSDHPLRVQILVPATLVMPRCRVRTVDCPCRESHCTALSAHNSTPDWCAGGVSRQFDCSEYVAYRQTTCTCCRSLPILSRGRGSFSDACNVETIERLFPSCEGKTRHGCTGNRKRGCRRKYAYVPSTDVEVTPSSTTMATILV